MNHAPTGFILRLKITVQYKGTNYKGWQVQANGVTVQEVLQKTLFRLFQKTITVIGASRTDSGVHALGQVCHIDLPLDPPLPLRERVGVRGSVDPDRLRHQLNSLLPPDIAVFFVDPVPDSFHAQKSAKRKVYDYVILNSRVPSPFLTDTAWQVYETLDVAAMRKAAKILVGEHDFSAFAASDRSTKTSVRRIYRVVIASDQRERSNPDDPTGLLRFARNDSNRRLSHISIEGNGFLKQMVRNIVGTLVDVGKGRTTPGEFKKILASKDRRRAGRCAPSRGLFLKSIKY